RTARPAVLAADAAVGVHVDDAVRVLHDRARRGARRETARVLAVHALVLAHEPHQRAVLLALGELDQVPVLRVERRHRLVGGELLRREDAEVVPLLARDLARLAADAGRRVDELRDDGELPHAGELSAQRGGRTADLESGVGHGRTLTPFPA